MLPPATNSTLREATIKTFCETDEMLLPATNSDLLSKRADIKTNTMPCSGLTILFSNEATAWDEYLTRRLSKDSGQYSAVFHLSLENLSFPLSTQVLQLFSSTKVVLIILSPLMLNFFERMPNEGYQIGRMLKPNRTVGLLCGVSLSDISSIHKAAMVSYDDWPNVVAKDKDIGVVRTVIETIQKQLLNAKVEHTAFKLVPRKVTQGNGRVYIILDEPLDQQLMLKVAVEFNGLEYLSVWPKNPYTWHFVIPDHVIKMLSIAIVHLFLEDNLLGICQVKCHTKKRQLYSLLADVVTPYTFLRESFPFSSLDEFDRLLSLNFKKNLPSGFSLLYKVGKSDEKKSKEELPTLLHFAAQYNLGHLAGQLLKSPGSYEACAMKNIRGMIPSVIAYNAGHKHLAGLIEDYRDSFMSSIVDVDLASPITRSTNDLYDGTYDIPRINPICINSAGMKPDVEHVFQEKDFEYLKMNSSSSSNKGSTNNLYDGSYDIPPSNPISINSVDMKPDVDHVFQEEGFEYLKMNGSSSSYKGSTNDLYDGTYDIPRINPICINSAGMKPDVEHVFQEKDFEYLKMNSSSSSNKGENKVAISESQQKLVEIMESYKKGASLTEVEKQQIDWKAAYQVSDAEAKRALEDMRKTYAKVQSTKQKKKNSVFLQFCHRVGYKFLQKDGKGSDGRSKVTHFVETEDTRPVSTVSAASNGSTSSGSSFDSGTQSDSFEDRKRQKEMFVQGFRQDQSPHFSYSSKFQQSSPTCFKKPPAPSPRPSRMHEYTKDVELHNQPSTTSTTGHLIMKPPDYVLPDPVTYGTEQEISMNNCSVYNSEVSNEREQRSVIRYAQHRSRSLYDSPIEMDSSSSVYCTIEDFPVNAESCAIPACCPQKAKPKLNKTHQWTRNASKGKERAQQNVLSSTSIKCDASLDNSTTDYDRVPPPFPVFKKPVLQISEFPDFPVAIPPYTGKFNTTYGQDEYDQLCNIPNNFSPKSDSFSSDYDFPKRSKDHFGNVKKISCHGNESQSVAHSFCFNDMDEIFHLNSPQSKNSLPSVPISESSFISNPVQISNDFIPSYYSNICCREQKFSDSEQQDSIPNEMAPPPPVNDDDEEYYKTVGEPVPVSDVLRDVSP